MQLVGSVAELLRKVERRTRSKWWGLVWGFPAGCVFRAGNEILPWTGSPLLNALLWAVYGLFWAGFVMVMERRLQVSGRMFSLTRPLGWVTLYTVGQVIAELIRGKSTFWAGLPGAIAFVVVLVADHIAATREVRAAFRDRRAHRPLERVV